MRAESPAMLSSRQAVRREGKRQAGSTGKGKAGGRLQGKLHVPTVLPSTQPADHRQAWARGNVENLDIPLSALPVAPPGLHRAKNRSESLTIFNNLDSKFSLCIGATLIDWT